MTVPLPTPPLDPSEMSTEEIYDEIFSSPLPQVRVLPDLCRGWQIGNPHGLLCVSVGMAACASPRATISTGTLPMPMNILMILMADSGGGKGLSMRVFTPEVAITAPVVVAPVTQGGVPVVGGSPSAPRINTGDGEIHWETPASGEAAVVMFYELVTDASGAKPKDVWQRHYNPVWSDWPEIDGFAAKAGIPGSSLEANVRQGWSGQQLGDSAINRKKSNLPQTVEADTYRWVKSVGGQYKKAGAVVGKDAAAGGTAQRAIFAEVEIDRSDFADTIEGREQQRLVARKRALRLLGLPIPANDDDVLMMDVPVIAIPGPGDRIVGMERDVLQLFADRRDVEDADVRKHAHLNTARIAAAHCGWRLKHSGGSDRITMEDWRFGSLMMELSFRTFAKARRIVSGEERAEDRHNGLRLAERQMTSDEMKARKRHLALMGAVERARRYVGANPGANRSEVTRAALNSTTRAVKIDAKSLMEACAEHSALRVEMGNIYFALDEGCEPVKTPTPSLAPLGLVEQALREYAEDPTL